MSQAGFLRTVYQYFAGIIILRRGEKRIARRGKPYGTNEMKKEILLIGYWDRDKTSISMGEEIRLHQDFHSSNSRLRNKPRSCSNAMIWTQH